MAGKSRRWRECQRSDSCRGEGRAAQPAAQFERAGSAGRVGLWLSGDRRGEAGTGFVVEAVSGPIPEQWKRLDVSTPFLRAALESTSRLQVEFTTGETAVYLGPLIGMHSAIWIPLRDRGQAFGLAMVGYARPPRALNPESLRGRADEITLAIQHQRNARRNQLAAEELLAHLQLSRAILSGVSTDFILTHRRAEQGAWRADGRTFSFGKFLRGFSKARILCVACRVGAGSRDGARGTKGVERRCEKNR
jgi:hypothetical protein